MLIANIEPIFRIFIEIRKINNIYFNINSLLYAFRACPSYMRASLQGDDCRNNYNAPEWCANRFLPGFKIVVGVMKYVFSGFMAHCEV